MPFIVRYCAPSARHVPPLRCLSRRHRVVYWPAHRRRCNANLAAIAPSHRARAPTVPETVAREGRLHHSKNRGADADVAPASRAAKHQSQLRESRFKKSEDRHTNCEGQDPIRSERVEPAAETTSFRQHGTRPPYSEGGQFQ